MTTPRTTSRMIARAVLARARRGAFGVLVRDMPEYEPGALVTELATGADGRPLRVAMPGFPVPQTRNLREIARGAGLSTTPPGSIEVE